MSVETFGEDSAGGVPIRDSSDTRAGDITVSPGQSRTRTIRIKNEAAIAAYGSRKPLEINGGEVPQSIVLPLAERKLAQVVNPRRSVNINLNGIDFTIRKGTLIKPHARSGVIGTFLVTAVTVTGTNLGRTDGTASIGAQIEAEEVVT